jgi:hypothetical protein
MPGIKQRVIDRLRRVDHDTTRLTQGDLDRSLGTADQRSRIATYKAERLFEVRQDRSFDLSVVATETKTTDGTADNTETFALGNDLIDSNAVADSLLLYEGSSRVEPDSVDFAANEFDYTSSGTDTTLTVYYTAGDQASIDIEKEAPSGSVEALWSDDVGMVHRRDQNKDPLSFGFRKPLQGVIPTDFRLNVYVTAPYTATLVGQDGDGNTTVEPAINALASFPIAGAPGTVEGAAKATRLSMAER